MHVGALWSKAILTALNSLVSAFRQKFVKASPDAEHGEHRQLEIEVHKPVAGGVLHILPVSRHWSAMVEIPVAGFTIFSRSSRVRAPKQTLAYH